jgi:hypothetical protein
MPSPPSRRDGRPAQREGAAGQREDAAAPRTHTADDGTREVAGPDKGGMGLDELRPSTHRTTPTTGVPSYASVAFHNVYNYSLLAGVAAASLLTQNWWLAVVGGGLEVLWMALAPDAKLLRRVWFDQVIAERQQALASAERQRLLAQLTAGDGQRVRRLEQQHARILQLCEDNRAFTTELLRGELRKIDRLTQSFFDLALATQRYERHLASVDLRELEAETRRHESIVQGSGDDERRALAQKNLAVLLKRRDKLTELKRFIAKARAQMDLIENTFQLLGDQVVSMRSPAELGGQLDDLIDGVEVVRSTTREAETLLA